MPKICQQQTKRSKSKVLMHLASPKLLARSSALPLFPLPTSICVPFVMRIAIYLAAGPVKNKRHSKVEMLIELQQQHFDCISMLPRFQFQLLYTTQKQKAQREPNKHTNTKNKSIRADSKAIDLLLEWH